MSGVKLIDSLQERVIGVYSLPSKILADVRFSQDETGRLILRCRDGAGHEWRDATVDDLCPPVFDSSAAQSRAVARAYQRGSYMSVAQALRAEQNRATPAFVGATDLPQYSRARAPIQANFFVTDGLPRVQSVPLLDLIEANGDPLMAFALEIARRGRPVKQAPAMQERVK